MSRTKPCNFCGKPINGASREKYCSAECFRANERNAAQLRQSKFSTERRRAGELVHIAKLNGELVARPCEVCGRGHVVAHHDDYSRPLEVRWLCKGCHQRHHLKFGPGKNAYRIEVAQ